MNGFCLAAETLRDHDVGVGGWCISLPLPR
ncbi:MAG: hypothetical protein JWR32_2395 [Mycobacterium sp.]|jgi:hypothetical protein|nr:hypothetical protein [Mycobacterium sp.]